MTKKKFIFYISVIVIFFSSMIASIHGYVDLVSIVSIFIALTGILLCESIYMIYKSTRKYHE